jgi:N-ethylmaleimide reductase
MQKDKLLFPLTIDSLYLKNRIVMLPMTRARSYSDNLATDMMALYYEQRASSGLVITEGTWPNDESIGFANVPGLFTEKQAESWEKVTNAVHSKGGKIFSQIGHCGPVAHPDLIAGKEPLSASAINVQCHSFTASGLKDTVTPRAMTKADIERTKRDFSKAAQYAKAAGFDGLELHSSGPFLFPAFLNSRLNVRKDEYGGSAENRARFLLETIDELIQVWGPGRVSVKLQPHIKLGAFAPNEDTEPTFRYVLEQLNHRKLAFLQLMGDQKLTDGDEVVRRPWIFARGILQGTILAGGAFTKELGENALQRNEADLIGFGELYIANPDLVARFRKNAPLNAPDRNFYYAGESKGYIDYEPLSSDSNPQLEPRDRSKI